MAVINAVEADPSLRHRPLVCAADPGGPCAHATGRRVPIPGQPLGKGALWCAACLFSLLALRRNRGVRAYVTVFVRLPVAAASAAAVVVVRR